MELLRHVLGNSAASDSGGSDASEWRESVVLSESHMAARELALLDVEAAIYAHQHWKTELMDYLEGRSSAGMNPEEVRRSEDSPVGQWLHGAGNKTFAKHPAYPLLVMRLQYFHEQAALVVELAQRGEWPQAVQVLHGGYRHGSTQVMLLLRFMQRSLRDQMKASLRASRRSV